jgi:fibronectin type III domain protein
MRSVRVLVATLAVVASSLSVVPGASAAADLPGSVYTPLPSPTRILDTRTEAGGHHRQVGPDETVRLAVPGLPPDATAVAINLTGTGGTGSTYLSTFPEQDTGTSTLNLTQGQTAAVAAIVTLGRGQSFNIRNNVGTVDVIVDLVGYFAAGTGMAFTSAPSPTRILDTRTPVGGHAGPLATGELVTLPVRGAAGVPADASAVVVNLTGVTPSADTYLGVTPDGRPGTSTLNLDPGATRANLAVVAIGQDGAIRIFNHVGSTHVVADVQGWFRPGSGGRYVALPAPHRVLDSRELTGPLGGATSRTVSFADSGVPTEGRIAVLFNLTGVLATAATFLTAWPHNQQRPLASNVNLDPGAIAPNAAISDTSTVDIYNNAGSTDIVVDAAGYFYTPTRPNPTVPGAPTLTGAANAGDRVRVTWSAADDGGVPLTGYTVTAQPGGRSATVDGSQHEVALAGLVPGIAYTVTVSATNLIGTGAASAPSGSVSPTSMTRVDTDASGTPDQVGDNQYQALSGDGRYSLLWVHSNSNLMPAAYRTPTDQGMYLVRKDLQSGELIVASVAPNGSPLRSNWPSAISQDGSTFTYSSWVHDGPSVLYVRDVAKHTVRAVFTDRPESFPARLTLSTDGQLLTWSSSVNDQGGYRIYQYRLHTGQTAMVLGCENPTSGCTIYTGPVVSNDGRKLLLLYRPTPADPIRLALLDTDTGTVRTLPEGEPGDGYTLSGDGNWVFYSRGQGCPSCGGGSFDLKKISTVPDATPVVLRSWQDSVTWVVYPDSSNEDGTLVGYFRQTGEGGKYFAAAPGYVLDLDTQREIRMPEVRDTAYVSSPIMSTDGRMAILQERCLWATDCHPVGTYAVSLPDLRQR